MNMNVVSKKKNSEKSLRDEHTTDNYKMLKRDFFEICSLI